MPSHTLSEIIEKYPQKNIQLISSMDKGIYDAMNQSVAYCNGKWVIFINSGDAFYSSALYLSTKFVVEIPVSSNIDIMTPVR